MNAARERFKRPVQMQAIDIAGRTPPNNVELEAAVVAAMLTNAECVDDVISILPNAEPFYWDAHRRIHTAICELHAAGKPIDIATLSNVLQRQERLQAVGGITYLTKIVDATPYIANIATYATEVRQLWRMRRIIEAGQQISGSGYTDYGDADEFMAAAVEKVANVADDKINHREGSQIYDVMKDVVTAYTTGGVRGTPTGFRDVDEKTGGMRDGELIIVAARPGAGKTAYAMNVAVNVAGLCGVPETVEQQPMLGVMVFSLEMPKDQLGQRMACTEGRVSLTAYRKSSLPPGEWDRLVVAVNDLSALPMWIDDTPAITLLDLRAKVRRRQHEFDKRWPGVDKWKQRIGLIIVDYLQLMRGAPNAQSREQEISEISRGLKAMSKDFGLPVMALSQLNRAVETRSTKDKRPQLSDLRESGAIEQDADMVQFIYRPEMYFTPEEADSDKGKKYKGFAEIIIAKQRNGPTGRVPVSFIDHCTRFENRARESWQGEDD